jgi:hypothetical protein
MLGESSSKIDTLLFPFFLPFAFLVGFDVDASSLAVASENKHTTLFTGAATKGLSGLPTCQNRLMFSQWCID